MNINSWPMRLLAFVLSIRAATSEEVIQNATSLGIVVFPGYEPLDIWGPLEVFSLYSRVRNMTLSIISHAPGLVSPRVPTHRMPDTGMIMTSFAIEPQILATHSFADAPELDILLIPGGGGLEVLELSHDTSVEDFVRARYPKLQYLLSVCVGSASLAMAGVLEGRRATSNKMAWNWVITHGKNVSWVPTARWVQDGNIWTSSGVAAGIDMTYAFLKNIYPESDADINTVMNRMEYAPHTDPHWDPFSVVNKVPGADLTESVVDCVRPVGY